MTAATITELHISVQGRPAPQGSKGRGSAGQMREQSVYLPAWRAAVKKAAYERFKALGVTPDDLPLLLGPISIGVTFVLPAGRRADSPPDLDKLLRSTWDALSAARVWEDDGRVVEIQWAAKRAALRGEPTGADIMVRRAAA